jgi:hypothetical protein
MLFDICCLTFAVTAVFFLCGMNIRLGHIHVLSMDDAYVECSGLHIAGESNPCRASAKVDRLGEVKVGREGLREPQAVGDASVVATG